jgi:hypothetical protein
VAIRTGENSSKHGSCIFQETKSVKSFAINDPKGSLTKSYLSFVERISKIKEIDKDKISTVGGFNEILNQLAVSENSDSGSGPKTPELFKKISQSQRAPNRSPNGIVQIEPRRPSYSEKASRSNFPTNPKQDFFGSARIDTPAKKSRIRGNLKLNRMTSSEQGENSPRKTNLGISEINFLASL